MCERDSKMGSLPSHTCFDRAVDVGFGFIIDPVEPGFHCQPGESAVFALVSVRRGDVHGSAFIMERFLKVVAVFVPALSDPQLHPGPLVHHWDGERVQLVLTSLRNGEMDQLVTCCVTVAHITHNVLQQHLLNACFSCSSPPNSLSGCLLCNNYNKKSIFGSTETWLVAAAARMLNVSLHFCVSSSVRGHISDKKADEILRGHRIRFTGL